MVGSLRFLTSSLPHFSPVILHLTTTHHASSSTEPALLVSPHHRAPSLHKLFLQSLRAALPARATVSHNHQTICRATSRLNLDRFDLCSSSDRWDKSKCGWSFVGVSSCTFDESWKQDLGRECGIWERSWRSSSPLGCARSLFRRACGYFSVEDKST